MAEKLEDFNLASSVIQRLVKETISDNINISKDARTALARAASVFILYVTSHACELAQKSNRKSLLSQDVLAALENLEFEDMIEPLTEFLNELRISNKEKKDKHNKSKDAEVIELTEDVEDSPNDVNNTDSS